MRPGKFPNMLRNFPHGCNFRARQHGWDCSPDMGRRAVNHCNEYSGTPRKNSVVIISNSGIPPRAFLALLHGRECAKVQGVHGVNSKFGIRAVGITGEENAPSVAKEFLERAFRHSAFPGNGNSLGGGEGGGQFRYHGKLRIGASSPMMPCTLIAVTRKYSVRRIALSTVAASIAFFFFAPHAQSERASRRQNRTA